MNQENERQRWREGLFQVFASEGHGREKCKSFAERYDQLTENGLSSSGAVGILLAAYSSTDAKTAHTTIKSWVESELEQFNAAHQGIDTNGKSRLKKAIQTLNANIDKCCILIDGQPLSSKEISRIKAVVPNCLQSPTIYETTAAEADCGKMSKLTLEVKI